tara:strand:- start:141 stop:1079 length:939 start_codon:yes stop_codon:yes gene_type:complete
MTEKKTIPNDKSKKGNWGEISSTPRFDKEKRQRGFSRGKSNVTWWAAYADLESEKVVQIESAERGVEYYCPECEGVMIPKKGDVLAHHFSHKPKSDGAPHTCVGEGNRHFRVKSFLHGMLNATKNHHFRYDIKVEMERRIDNDQPDIVVRFEQQNILAIEIVDTNPPSKEKRLRWKDKMLEIQISDWEDEVIIDASKLSGLLIPQILTFDRFIAQIETKEKDLSKFNKGTSTKGIESFIHKMDCWKCDEEILVYSGSTPDDIQISAQDILRHGVCYSYRYVPSAKTKNKWFWMNVCPHCDRSQGRQKVRELR